MPHHKSAAKRVLTNAQAQRRNTALRTRMRAAVRAVRAATTRPAAEAAYREAVAVLDRTAAKGVIKRAAASRHKSRLARYARSLSA